jgi:hypothetical protein
MDRGVYFGLLGTGDTSIAGYPVPTQTTVEAIVFVQHEDGVWGAAHAKKDDPMVTVYDGIGEDGRLGPARAGRMAQWEATLLGKLQEDAWFASGLRARDGGIYTHDDPDTAGYYSLAWAEYRASGWPVQLRDCSHVGGGWAWNPLADFERANAVPAARSDITWEDIIKLRFRRVADRGQIRD